MDQLQQVTVAAVYREGHDNVALRLEPTTTALAPFAAGAHVDVHLADGLVRQYSIASAPHQLDHYLLCVKLAAESRGGSRQVCTRLAAGDPLQISMPRNLFALHDGTRQVLIAAGIGITPLLSMAHALDARGEPFVLHYYVSRRADVAFAEQWARGFVHGRVLVHASEDGESPRSHIPLEIRAATSRDHLYLCGPAAFMNRFSALANGFGWVPGQIHQEHFGATNSGRDSDAAFEVELASSGRVVRVDAGTTIAQALRDAGETVAVSCEQGMCGACLTGLVAGEPEHRDSVLSADARAANRQIALCCSRSRGPRLTLDL